MNSSEVIKKKLNFWSEYLHEQMFRNQSIPAESLYFSKKIFKIWLRILLSDLKIRDLDAHHQIKMDILIYKNQYWQTFEGRGYFQHYLFIALFRLTGYKNYLTQVFYLGFPCEIIDTRVEKMYPKESLSLKTAVVR